MATVQALISLFKEQKDVDITDVEAAAKPLNLVGTDITSKKSHLRHVLFDVVASKWQEKAGAAPTEWDLEALFKEFPRHMEEELKTVKSVNGANDAIKALQDQGIKVAAASNFSGETMATWMRIAHANGFEFDDCMSCADVPNPGREGAFSCVMPEPWRCLALAAKMGIFPMSTTIRVSSTHHGIEEGLNAGMWTVALSTTGLPDSYNHGSETEQARNNRVREGFYRLGCHHVVDGVWDLPEAVAKICAAMERGEKP
jgi:phosphonoacetaldehyde hydrolase